jgi:DNA polymerase-1
MILKPATPEAYRLIHDGIRTLARVEEVGIGVDLNYVKQTRDKLAKEIRQLEARLTDTEEYERLRQHYGSKANLNSAKQQADLLYKFMQYEVRHVTDKGTPSIDEQALQEIGTDFTKMLLRLKKKQKLHGTFLSGILAETEGDRLHCFFNLHIARTFRSSSDSINFQNLPVRDKEMAAVIRSAFVARPGFHIVETDYAGIEVRGAACYHKDPKMLRYIKDPSKCMHRDMAIQCYRLEGMELPAEFWKSKDPTQGNGHTVRYAAKNMFVFPSFYGDYFVNMARNMWEAIVKLDLRVSEKLTLLEHLAKKGIRQRGDCIVGGSDPAPGTFEHHIREVENDFWNNRFKVYGKWKRSWFDEYLRTGGFHMLTGFRIEGVLSKNDVINWPVQGASFHCLLWSMIELDNEMRRRKMKSRVVGQIHDSIVGEVHHKELSTYAELIDEIMTKRIRDHWDWIIVPLDIEMEVTPVGGTWHQKKAYPVSDIVKGIIS